MSLRRYLDKLVALGHKVGVVEQMETPAELEARNAQRPKGQKKETAVRRELCEVRTLGTDPENEKPAATQQGLGVLHRGCHVHSRM